MRSPPFDQWIIFDKNGNMVFEGRSPPSFSNDMDDQAQKIFQNFNQGVNSTMKWATIASVGKPIEFCLNPILKTCIVSVTFSLKKKVSVRFLFINNDVPACFEFVGEKIYALLSL